MPRQTTRKFWQTQTFRELKKEWEEKLKNSDFVDAESNGTLRQNAANSYRTVDPVTIENKRRYYELLGHWYHEETFEDAVADYIMKRRCEGVNIKQIGLELKEKKHKNSRETIRKIIRYFENKWGIKKKKTRL